MEESAKEAYNTCSPSPSHKILQDQQREKYRGNLKTPQEEPLFNPLSYNYYPLDGRIISVASESPSKTDKDRDLLHRLSTFSSARSSRNSAVMTPSTRASRHVSDDFAFPYKYYNGLHGSLYEQDDCEYAGTENSDPRLNGMLNPIGSKPRHRSNNLLSPEDRSFVQRILHKYQIPEEEYEDERQLWEEEEEEEVFSSQVRIRASTRKISTDHLKLSEVREPVNMKSFDETEEGYVIMEFDNNNDNDNEL